MRITTVIGAAILVVIVAVVVVLSLPANEEVTEEAELESESDDMPPGSGQFFQQIPIDQEPSPSPAAQPSSVSGNISISMSEMGFSPTSVSISAGDEVTFVNDGQAAHWPASDVHPTHAILSGFNAKRGLATGEAYSYVFAVAGTWQCHDHLMPQYKCEIIVK